MSILSALPPESALELLEAVPKSLTYRGNHNTMSCSASTDSSIPRTSLSSNASCSAQSRSSHQEHQVDLFYIKWDFLCIE